MVGKPLQRIALKIVQMTKLNPNLAHMPKKQPQTAACEIVPVRLPATG